MRASLIVLLLIVLLSGAMTSGSISAAQEMTPPLIIHEPVRQALSDANLIICAKVSAESPLERATLFFRTQGTVNYYSLQMARIRDEYRAAIPASYMKPGIVEYYLHAMDSAGNSTTYPGEDAARRPVRISISKDTSAPHPELMTHSSPVSGEGFEVFVLLRDAAGNTDPSSVRVYWNEQDVTAMSMITATGVLYRVPAHDVALSSSLTVEAADLAGNRAKRTFRFLKAPDWWRELTVDVEGGESLAANLHMSAAWGPLYLRAILANADPFFSGQPGQPENCFELQYDARLMRLGLGDVTSGMAPLALDALQYRGSDLELRLGPLSFQGIYGFPKRAVPGEDYQRQLVGLRPAFDTRALDFALSVVKIRDEWSEGNEVSGVNPEVNYVVDAQAGVAIFGGRAGLNTEVALSLYHDNARGDFWAVIDSLKDDPNLGPEYKTVFDALEKIPPGARAFFHLPDVRYGLPKIDVGAQTVLRLPLPWSEFSARGYRFGRSYQTIAGAGESNGEGYQANYSTIRLLNAFQLSAEYEKKTNNVASLIDIALATHPSERTMYERYGTELSLGPTLGPNLDLAGTLVTQAPAGTEQPEKRTTSYTVELRSLRFGLGSMRLRLGASGGGSLMQVLTDPTGGADKQTNAYKLATGLDMGTRSYDVVCALKREADGRRSNVVNNPSISASVTQTWRRPSVFSVRLQDVRLRASLAHDMARDRRGTQFWVKNTFEVQGSSRLTANTRLGASWHRVVQSGEMTETKLTTSFRWRF